MNGNKILRWSIVIALGGFLFGFDTAVISGAEQYIQRYWSLNAFQHGLTISIALIGTIIGSLGGAYPSDALGRKTTLYLVAALYLVSALGCALSTNWYLFLAFRLMGGLGVGASSVTAPVYISEIAPAAKRGRLVALFQFNVVFGILVSYLSNYLIASLAGESWRLMLGIQAVPSLVFLLLLFRVPESPRWLILYRNRVQQARHILNTIDASTAEAIVQNIVQAATEKQMGKKPRLFNASNKVPIVLAVMFAVFNQVSGINAIIYYAPRIFEMTGLGASSSLLSTVGLGVINFIFTLLALNLIDRFGRRTLMLIGSFGLIVTLALVSWCFYSGSGGITVAVFLFIYIAFFAFSQGAVIWVFISEIFPSSVRAKGQTLGSTTHWLMAAIIAFAFPYVAERAGGGTTFLFFAVMMIAQLLFVWRVMPETKGRPLEQLEHQLILH
ncbi:sugar porter family MFS transporter [Deminuibacter soli]|uniref:MFS transporter n=1 Tax=Deminuibacter soli TaxID=2291815 RepID=A0A3E1NFM5_9BACT|nr:sugar porter family MFS transporter [Deminuibacter soli]RFM26773.1 MFS transporter [Deminuibacter soli]